MFLSNSVQQVKCLAHFDPKEVLALSSETYLKKKKSFCRQIFWIPSYTKFDCSQAN